MKAIVFTVFSLMVTGTVALAGQLTSENNDYCDWKFTGQIVEGDAGKIQKIPTYTGGISLCLDSPGGSLSEALKIFELIWSDNLTTMVLPGDRCESACAIAFLGGSTLEGTDVTRQIYRVIWPGARLGFHGPSLDLNTGQSYQDKHINTAFKTALDAAARLFEVNRTQDRGNRAMNDHLLHRWLNTDPASMYFIDTVGDAILSGIPVTGIDYDFQLTRDHIRNICDNVMLKGSYPSGNGLSASIHSGFTDTATLYDNHKQYEWDAELEVHAEIRDGRLEAVVEPYSSGTKYHLNACRVSFDAERVAEFDFQNYIYLSTPIDVQILAYDQLPEPGVDFVAWANEQSVLQERDLTPIYLFPFDTRLADLPKSREHDRAITLPPREVDDLEWSTYMRMISFIGRDLAGGDFETIASEDLNDCTSRCLANTACVAVTHDRWNNLCFLKGAGAFGSDLTVQPKATTYVRAEYAFSLAESSLPPIIKHRKNKGFDGYAYETLNAASFDSCSALCLEDKACLVVNYRANTASCEKIEYPDEYFTMEGVEIGLKLQVE